MLIDIHGRDAVAQALEEAVELGAYGSDYLNNILAHRRTLGPLIGQPHLTRGAELLDELIAGEVDLRHDRSVQRRIHDARFPVTKTMAGWDWNWPTKINRMQVEHLLQLDFIDTCTNVIFAGPTGTGKTHLATALGYAACLRGHSVLFAAAIDVVTGLALQNPVANSLESSSITRAQGFWR